MNIFSMRNEKSLKNIYILFVDTKKGKDTCRYICLSVKGFVCMKKTPMKKTLDERSKEGKMKAQSDNCRGLGDQG